MKSNQNIVIVLLFISAAVLAGFLIADVKADAPTTSGRYAVVRPLGIYTMCTGAWDANIDILYVLDIHAQKLNAYVPNLTRDGIEQHDSISLPQAMRR
jgi:hypothetical protein